MFVTYVVYFYHASTVKKMRQVRVEVARLGFRTEDKMQCSMSLSLSGIIVS